MSCPTRLWVDGLDSKCQDGWELLPACSVASPLLECAPDPSFCTVWKARCKVNSKDTKDTNSKSHRASHTRQIDSHHLRFLAFDKADIGGARLFIKYPLVAEPVLQPRFGSVFVRARFSRLRTQSSCQLLRSILSTLHSSLPLHPFPPHNGPSSSCCRRAAATLPKMYAKLKMSVSQSRRFTPMSQVLVESNKVIKAKVEKRGQVFSRVGHPQWYKCCPTTVNRVLLEKLQLPSLRMQWKPIVCHKQHWQKFTLFSLKMSQTAKNSRGHGHTNFGVHI